MPAIFVRKCHLYLSSASYICQVQAKLVKCQLHLSSASFICQEVPAIFVSPSVVKLRGIVGQLLPSQMENIQQMEVIVPGSSRIYEHGFLSRSGFQVGMFCGIKCAKKTQNYAKKKTVYICQYYKQKLKSYKLSFWFALSNSLILLNTLCGRIKFKDINKGLEIRFVIF